MAEEKIEKIRELQKIIAYLEKELETIIDKERYKECIRLLLRARWEKMKLVGIKDRW